MFSGIHALMNYMAVFPEQQSKSSFLNRARGGNQLNTDDIQKSELWNRVMQTKPTSQMPQTMPTYPSTPWYRKTFPFPIIIGGRGVGWSKIPILLPIIITPFVIIVFVVSFFNNGQSAQTTNTSTNETPTSNNQSPFNPNQDNLTDRVTNLFSLSNVNTQDLVREKTTASTKKFQYLNYSVEINNSLISSNKIIEGYASQQPAYQIDTAQIQSATINYSLDARSINDQTLNSTPVLLDADNNGAGLAYGTLQIPIGTNSVVLVNKSGKVLDQIYVPAESMEIQLYQIPTTIDSRQTLSLTGTITPSDQTYFIDVVLFSATTDQTIDLIQNLYAPTGRLDYEFDINQYDIPRTSSWFIQITAKSFFEYQYQKTDTFIIRVQ